jgi:hypothetical protein
MTAKRPTDAAVVAWLQRINDQFGPIVRWTGFLGFVIFASLNQLAVASAFAGLIPVSWAVGRVDP